MSNANNLRFPFQKEEVHARITHLHAPDSFIHSMTSLLHDAGDGIDKLFPKSFAPKVHLPKINILRKRKSEDTVMSLMLALPGKEESFQMPFNKRYIDALSLQKILSIKTGNLTFKKAHFLSIFTNRRAIVFTASGNTPDQAKFMADLWYHEWRKDQKHKNIAVKIIEKEYICDRKNSSLHYCELKVKYAFKLIKD